MGLGRGPDGGRVRNVFGLLLLALAVSVAAGLVAWFGGRQWVVASTLAFEIAAEPATGPAAELDGGDGARWGGGVWALAWGPGWGEATADRAWFAPAAWPTGEQRLTIEADGRAVVARVRVGGGERLGRPADVDLVAHWRGLEGGAWWPAPGGGLACGRRGGVLEVAVPTGGPAVVDIELDKDATARVELGGRVVEVAQAGRVVVEPGGLGESAAAAVRLRVPIDAGAFRVEGEGEFSVPSATLERDVFGVVVQRAVLDGRVEGGDAVGMTGELAWTARVHVVGMGVIAGGVFGAASIGVLGWCVATSRWVRRVPMVVWVVLAAAAARVLATWGWPTVVFDHDSIHYLTLGQLFFDGGWREGWISSRAPGYPAMLALFTGEGGALAGRALVATQHAMGVVTAACVCVGAQRLATGVGGPAVGSGRCARAIGLAAGLFVALDPMGVVYERMVMTEAVSALLIAACAAVLVCFGGTERRWRGLVWAGVFGVVVAAAALTRPSAQVVAVLGPIAFGIVALAGGAGMRVSAVRCVVAGAVMLGVVLPWVGFMEQRFGHAGVVVLGGVGGLDSVTQGRRLAGAPADVVDAATWDEIVRADANAAITGRTRLVPMVDLERDGARIVAATEARRGPESLIARATGALTTFGIMTGNPHYALKPDALHSGPMRGDAWRDRVNMPVARRLVREHPAVAREWLASTDAMAGSAVARLFDQWCGMWALLRPVVAVIAIAGAWLALVRVRDVRPGGLVAIAAAHAIGLAVLAGVGTDRYRFAFWPMTVVATGGIVAAARAGVTARPARAERDSRPSGG